MTFLFQKPGTPKFIDSVNGIAQNAESGGGVFAFASQGGIDTLFQCSNLCSMLENNKHFHLIIGIDAITNAEALLCLEEKIERFSGYLTVNVFFHQKNNSTFHPKFIWFKNSKFLNLMVGSGNLTLRGLGQVLANSYPSGNWEVFAVQKYEDIEAESTIKEIGEWIKDQYSAGTLRPINDKEVQAKAIENGRVRYTNGGKGPSQDNSTESAQDGNLNLHGEEDIELHDVLIREISRNRTGQADVGQGALREFFGYDGTNKKIFMQHVTRDNRLEEVLEINLFVNKSRNFRLELRAIAELDYVVANDDGRMILVATRIDRRSFRYIVMPVSEAAYRKVASLLGPIQGPPGKRLMREIRKKSKEVLSVWPDIPDKLLPILYVTDEP